MRSNRAFLAEQANTNAYLRGCQGKMAHASKAHATAAVRRLVRDKGADPRLLQCYKCRVCKRWHVGNNTRKVVPVPTERVFQSTFHQVLVTRLRDVFTVAA